MASDELSLQKSRRPAYGNPRISMFRIMNKSHVCGRIAGIALCSHSLLIAPPSLAQQGQTGLNYFVDAVCAYRRDHPKMTAEAAFTSFVKGFVAEISSNGTQATGYATYFSPTGNVKGDVYNAGIAGDRFIAWQRWSRSLPPGSKPLLVTSDAVRRACP